MAKVISSIVMMVGWAFAMTGCAGNQVRSSWDDPECSARVQNAYLMGYGVGYDDAKSKRNYNPEGLQED